MKRFAVRVFGCQMNAYDGDRIRTSMIHLRLTECPEEDAEVVILVTCSIREKAEQKVVSEIGAITSDTGIRISRGRARGLHGAEDRASDRKNSGA